MVDFLQKIRNRMRLIVQVGFMALTNGYVLGFIKGKIYKGSTKALCVPGLNCYSCPGALGACPIGSLQAVLGSRNYRFSFYIIGFLIFIGSLIGRFVCGWLCPFGLIQDLLYKIPFFKNRKRKNLPGHKWLVWLKYVILVVFVILLPMFYVDIIGQGSPWFCQFICPSGTLTAGIPLVLLNEDLRGAIGFLFAWKAAILYRYQVDETKCNRCGNCQRACKMDIRVWEIPNSRECIRCGDCIKSCKRGAICTTMKKNKSEGERNDK